jgi:class I fructose-bisphosphate aldolase
MLEVAAAKYPGRIPLILKMNSANSLLPRDLTPTQAVTASVEDALRLGCSAIGFTIYPGSHNSLEMIEQIKDLSFKAKQYGLAVVIWSYPRGGDLTPTDQTAIDICSYAAHMAALIGAHIIKVKLPSEHIALEENKKIYNKQQIDISSITARVKHVVKACFNGRRMVVFSGGTTKNANTILEETESIASGGGNGSIIGRNIFQRPREEALFLLQKMIDIYKGL